MRRTARLAVAALALSLSAAGDASVARGDDGGAAAVKGLGPSAAGGGAERSDTIDPDAPTVGASIDHTEPHVGDRLTLTVSAIARPGVVVTLPARLELGKLELLDRQDGEHAGRDLGNGRFAFRFVLGVAAYEVGELEVPPLPVNYLDKRGEIHVVETAPIPLHVASLIADEQKPEPQPPRPPRSALVEDRRVMAVLRWGGLGVAALALVLLLVRLTRRALRRVVPTALAEALPSRPPEEVAMERLRAIREAGNFALDGYRPFYFAVAEVVREYLGARYQFDALELTTTELLDMLALRAVQLAASDGDVARFLNDSDLVKFAKAGSTLGAAEEALRAAETIVLTTTQAAAPAAAQPDGEPGEPPAGSAPAAPGDDAKEASGG